MSSPIFLMVRCTIFNSSRGAASSEMAKLPSLSVNKRQSFAQKFVHTINTVGIPWFRLFQRPKNISYRRNVSAPYWAIISSGFTTLNIDFDIFSTAQPHTYLPSSKINSALLYSGFHCFKAFNIQHIIVHHVHINMNGRGIVIFLRLSDTKVLVPLTAVNKIAASLYHALVDELFKGLIFHHQPNIEQKLVPKARINQVAGGVFGTTNVQIHILPILVSLSGLPRRCYWLDPCNANSRPMNRQNRAWCSTQRITIGCLPVFGATQWWFAFFGGQVFINFGQGQWQLLRFREHAWHKPFCNTPEMVRPNSADG
jgi:hypothetical protein